MKIIILIVGLFSLFGCSGSGSGSSGPCAGSAVAGNWHGTNGGLTDTLSFSGTCNFTDTLCADVGTYPDVTASSGNVLVTITANNGGGTCLPVGQTSCAYAVSGTTLQYNCGGGVMTFTKQ